MPYAETKADGEQRREAFVRTYRMTEGKAVATLLRDWDRMVPFYSLPQEHWRHLRTTNIVESPLRRGTAPHRRVPPLQARGGSPGDHLEDAPDRRAVVEEAERAGAVAAGGRRHDVHRWNDANVRPRGKRRDSSAGKDRCLKHIYTPLDGG